MKNEAIQSTPKSGYEARLDAARTCILTNHEYEATPFARGEEGPLCVYELTSGDKHLVFIGGVHTVNPDHPQFAYIEQVFATLQPEIVYAEGHADIADRKEQFRLAVQNRTLAEAKAGGESRFALKLAIDAGVDFESPEPNASEEIAALVAAGYTKSDIFTFYQYRLVSQYQRESQDENKVPTESAFRQYMAPSLKGFARDSGWEPSELTGFEATFFSELDLNDTNKYPQLVTPVPVNGKYESVLNEISNHSSHFRDEYILGRLAKGLAEHDTLFIVYGSAHAVKLEPALRALMQDE